VRVTLRVLLDLLKWRRVREVADAAWPDKTRVVRHSSLSLALRVTSRRAIVCSSTRKGPSHKFSAETSPSQP
jgi:hypothetical protein